MTFEPLATMRSCSWSPSCRLPARGEWCDAHNEIMAPLFRPIARSGARRPKSVQEALLRKLDDDRAEVIARFVGEAGGPVRLDGRSDALQRAVATAVEAGWISTAGGGYVAGPVEVGHRAAASEEPPEAVQPPPETRRVEMICAYIERSDHAPMKAEIVRDLNLTLGTATSALQAGRERGVFHVPHSGSRAYALGPCPPPRDLAAELTEYVRKTGGTNGREAGEALEMCSGEMSTAIRAAVAAGTITSSRGRGRTILPAG